MLKVSNISIPTLGIYKYISGQVLPEVQPRRDDAIPSLSVTTRQDLTNGGLQTVNISDLAGDDKVIVCVIKIL